MTESFITIKNTDVFDGGSLKPSALQRYMQSLAFDDCESIGCTYKALRALGAVFVITKLGMKFSRAVKEGETLKAVTYNNKVGGITFIREFEFYSGETEVIHATTEWVLVNFDTRAIVRPRDLPFDFVSLGKECASVPLPRAFAFPELDKDFEREVTSADLDDNLHLNNCVYSDIALSGFVFDAKKVYPKETYIIFRHEAREGEKLLLKTAENGYEKYLTAENVTKNTQCFDFKAVFDDING